MSVKYKKVLQNVSGWEAFELLMQCIIFGIWQFIQISIKRLWKVHRRKFGKDFPPVELTVDSSLGTHCYIKIMGVKYHYVRSGPKTGQTILVLGDAPNNTSLWSRNWSKLVSQLSQSGYQVITLDLRGTGGSESGGRQDLSPPQVVQELSTLLDALGVSESQPAVVVGFGVGGLVAWYLAHCYGYLVEKLVIVGAPHPNLYWQFPPTNFCQKALHFIQWPNFPEKWLAEGQQDDADRWASTRARDWTGALNYIRGAAWYRIRAEHKVQSPALIVGTKASATELVVSAQYCSNSSLRLVDNADPTDQCLPALLLDFLLTKEQSKSEEPRGLMGRVLAAAYRGRDLTARLVSPPALA